jgi:hypothetical protein
VKEAETLFVDILRARRPITMICGQAPLEVHFECGDHGSPSG